MKIICVGRNYAEHAKELSNAVPTEPVLFMKAKNALLGPDKPMYYPEFTDDLQYEGELVLRICKNGRHIGERFARSYYNEVTVGIDFTARDVQNRLKEKRLPWEISKAFDHSAAVGRFIPLGDRNVSDLHFALHLNGTIVQEAGADEMIFSADKIIAYASEYFTLNIGDLVFTGTPAGVGSLNVYDNLEGYLEGEQVLDVSIR